MVVRAWLAFLICCGLAGCSGERVVPNTELVLVADTDIDELDRIEFTIRAGTRSRMASGSIREGSPASLAILRDDGPLGPVTVAARGFSGENLFIERRAVVSFVPNQTLVVELHLLASCASTDCAEGETCTERGCEAEEIPRADLTAWTGKLPRLPAQPGSDAGTEDDAGVYAGQDASLGDAAAQDAGDAGPDAALASCGAAGVVDLDTNLNHCGKCGKACNDFIFPYYNVVWACRAAQCVYACAPLYGNCDLSNINGCEKSLINDSSSCGACGFQCGASETCNNQGRCVPQ